MVIRSKQLTFKPVGINRPIISITTSLAIRAVSAALLAVSAASFAACVASFAFVVAVDVASVAFCVSDVAFLHSAVAVSQSDFALLAAVVALSALAGKKNNALSKMFEANIKKGSTDFSASMLEMYPERQYDYFEEDPSTVGLRIQF